MDTLSSISCFSTSTQCLLRKASSKPFFKRNPPKFSFHRASSNPVRELAEEDILRMFIKERELNGDFISKASDMFWLRAIMGLVEFDAAKIADPPQEAPQVIESQDDGGFLKLTRTQEWISGAYSAPMNKKARAKAMQDDSDRRKKLNFLKYEALFRGQLDALLSPVASNLKSCLQRLIKHSGFPAKRLKRELMLLSVGIGTACTGYCLIALSVQAAISYAVGVLFSCLYLQLLCKHADNLSQEMIPPIFMKKKSKKIGIRSEDLSDALERAIKGSGMALSSPRLVIPAAVYGLWILSHRYFSNDIFDLQIVPAMFGMFAYKAAALVQVYRDNENLRLIFPENVKGSSE